MEEIEFEKRFNQALSRLNKAATIKDCFHYNKYECRLPIKNAHSLQKLGALKILESEKNGNRYLYAHTERTNNLLQNFLDLKPIGKKAASTFFGFCDKHDTELFSVLENDPNSTDILSDEHCFLHSYRSFAHSYHRKHEDYKLYHTKDSETLDLLIEMLGQKKLEWLREGVILSIRDLDKTKKKLNDLIENKIYDGLEYFAIEYPYCAPVACAALTSPFFCYSGKPINITISKDEPLSDIITTVLPFSNRTVIILSAFKDEPVAIEYIDEIDNIKYDLQQQKFLSFHLMNYAENCYISPKYYEKQNINWRKEYCNFLDISGDQSQPIMKFNTKFRFNYFDPLNSIS